MSETKRTDDKRVQHVALAGFAIQLMGLLLLSGVHWWTESSIIAVLVRIMQIGVPIWFVLYLVLNQIRRVGVEALETEEIKRARESGSDIALFEVDDDALLIEQNKLRWMVRWFMGACTVGLALRLLIGHSMGWDWSMNQAFDAEVMTRTSNPFMMMWFVVGVGLACYLFAHYALGLASLPQWGLLRAGAVTMAGSALACVLAAIAIMAGNTIEWAEPLLAYLFRIVLLLLGIEFSINFILDLYRPRVPGEVPRPSFDSRLLGMVAQPGGFAKSIADAFNYQFGFNVSSTWFYQLLQRWLFPLTVMSFLGIILLSSVVVVDADEKAVIERWGRKVESRGVLTSGIYLKWPFPMDILHRAPVKRIKSIVIGEAEDEDDHGHDEAIVWTKQHNFLPELMLLVAKPKPDIANEGDAVMVNRDETENTDSVSVSLLMVSVPIEYRIKDLQEYLYNYDQPERLLESIAYQFLSDYAAGVDYNQLMGPGRMAFNQQFKRRVQQRLDELHLGIEIVFAGIRDAHPTAENNVASTFEQVVSAEIATGALIHKAEGEAQKTLTSAVGSVSRALALDEAIQEREQLEAGTPAHQVAQQRVRDLLTGHTEKGIPPVSGHAAEVIAYAKARSSKRISQALSKVRQFGAQLAAYRAAPELFKQRKYLETYEGIELTRKFLIVGDFENVIIEYETAKEAGLDQVLTKGEGSSDR